jgi:peptide/nickel transport system ATP-binding protein
VAPLLEISDLRTEIRLRQGVVHAVDGVSFDVEPGQTLGIVGESGCGKTMTALSIMNLLPTGGAIAGGSIKLNGTEISALTDEQMRNIRGNEIGMIFQDPLTSLNPTMTVGRQIAEVVSLHREVSKEQAMDRAAEVLDLVGIPRVQERIKEYPHQFSGGMRQRVMIAMALACEPKLLIADEPTTALDVTIQKQILELIDDLRLRLGMSVILVTHDLGVIAGRADRVAVMYAGKIAEITDTGTLFSRPRHPYTEALFQALPDKAAEAGERLYSIPGIPPDLVGPSERSQTGRLTGFNTSKVESALPGPGIGDVLLNVEHLVKDYAVTRGAVLQRRVGWLSAVADVNFTIRSGETFGLVGESGCGKSTMGKLVVGLEHPTSGSINFKGKDLAKSSPREYRRERRDIQLMFQDSYASLDPRMRAGTLLREPLVIQGIGTKDEQRAKVAEMLDKVGLPRNAADRYPHEFSGGQRQRLGFARALMLNPQLIVADEPVSALDVSIQAQVLNMMKELQHDLGLTYLFISHDLGVVRYLSEKIGVMYLGKLVEVGPAEEVYLRPAHPYTRGLLDSAPVADPEAEKAKVTEGVTGELPSAIHPPSGCRFRTRCPLAQEICANVEPPMQTFSEAGQQAACHFPLQNPLSGNAVSTTVLS